MRRYLLLLTLPVVIGLSACPPQPTPPSPSNDADYCAQMCQHLGPADAGGLGCEEGNPVYDSDKPGPTGVPNKSCTDFCKDQETNGIHINAFCVMKVTSCSEIEAARQKTCQ